MHRPLRDVTFVAIDTETTGSSARRYADRIVELAAVRFTLDGVTEVWEQTIWPHRPMNPMAQRVHGISIDDLSSAPCFQEVADDFLAFVEGAVVVMHNAPFDSAFLGVQLAEIGRRWEPVVFDTLRLLRRHFRLPRNSLEAGARHFGLPVAPTHRAADDATATAHLFLRILEQLGSPTLLADCTRWHGAPGQIPCTPPPPPPPDLIEATRTGMPVAIEYLTRQAPLIGRIEGLAIGESAAYCTLRLSNQRRLHLAYDRIRKIHLL